MSTEITLTESITIPARELVFSAMRAQGPGGQNVNKVSSAVQLRLDIPSSSLPPDCKARLLKQRDRRISADGVLIIKSQEHRSQERNREAAINRLTELVKAASTPRKRRVATKPTRSSQKKRLDRKQQRGRVKNLRGRVDPE
ncbi:MAG: alternative ribosome rescue aminoacyl-tRNA hydrolase ArfB [Pseudomonadota bacterium]